MELVHGLVDQQVHGCGTPGSYRLGSSNQSRPSSNQSRPAGASADRPAR
jgi:hypothetical protein